MYQKLPVGADIFVNMREQDFYYIDKTNFIRDLLLNRGEVNLFTRPRRFGKTLNMTMLQAFFEIGVDRRDIFFGLDILKEQELCEQHMNRYPVIFLSLKSIEGKTFAEAMAKVGLLVADECVRLSFLGQNQRIDKDQRLLFKSLKARKADHAELGSAIKALSRMLEAHYGQKVVLLVDEYDVPLEKAFHNGYYDDMVSFMRQFLGDAFKTNTSLAFAVVTGCLRISNESIFTGLNNIKIDDITSDRYDESFGFTDADVRKILTDYNLTSAYEELRAWYDGYHFGDTDVYCPWDIINHVDRLLENPKAEPEAYWNNTSSNEIVKRFIDKAGASTRNEIERLIAGDFVEKPVRINLTYAELDENIDNLWSVLFLTGYLTRQRTTDILPRGTMRLVIPNAEIKEIFVEKIQKWFAERVKSTDRSELDALHNAFLVGNRETIETILNAQLRATISYYDANESFYHGFLAGLLKGCGSWGVGSNRESGDGRSDILVIPEDYATGIVIEIKHARGLEDIPAMCEAAMRQIEEKNYQDGLLERGISSARLYGVAFWKKNCGVITKSVQLRKTIISI
ncbi:MAG: ATP-binding protein [Clostridiales bacterium]|jgi:hypothetical protein|nr:ATP-binding protein [Clostridiales bacterium]